MFMDIYTVIVKRAVPRTVKDNKRIKHALSKDRHLHEFIQGMVIKPMSPPRTLYQIEKFHYTNLPRDKLKIPKVQPE